MSEPGCRQRPRTGSVSYTHLDVYKRQGQDRLPQVVHPAGLSYAPREGAGEVQTPLSGKAARQLSIGDRVWLRHTKSGEIMEHANEVVPVQLGSPGNGGSSALEPIMSYRGEGKCFL